MNIIIFIFSFLFILKVYFILSDEMEGVVDREIVLANIGPEQVQQLLDFALDHRKMVAELIKSVNDIIHDSLSVLTEGFSRLGYKAHDRGAVAERRIQEAYLGNIDRSRAFRDVQKSVDSLIEKFLACEDYGEIEISQEGAAFSKGLEAVSLLDKNISHVLMGLMGSLSNDDVISQRLVKLTKIVELEHSLLQGLRPISLSLTNDRLNEIIPYFAKQLEEALKTPGESVYYARYFSHFGGSKASSMKFNDSPHRSMCEFLSALSLLVSDLIFETSDLIFNVVSLANNSIFSLQTKAIDSRRHAHSRMRIQESGDFAVEEVEADVAADVREFFDEMSEELNSAIFEMMGILSFGDVATQRLTTAGHVTRHLACMLVASQKDSLAFDPEVLSRRIYACKQNSFSCFVTEDDRKIFRKGFPKVS